MVNSWTKLVHDLMKDALCTKAKNLKMEQFYYCNDLFIDSRCSTCSQNFWQHYCYLHTAFHSDFHPKVTEKRFFLDKNNPGSIISRITFLPNILFAHKYNFIVLPEINIVFQFNMLGAPHSPLRKHKRS